MEFEPSDKISHVKTKLISITGMRINHQKLCYSIYDHDKAAWVTIDFEDTDTILEVQNKIIAFHGSIKNFLSYVILVFQQSKLEPESMDFGNLLEVLKKRPYPPTWGPTTAEAEKAAIERIGLELKLPAPMYKDEGWIHLLPSHGRPKYLTRRNKA